MTICDAAGEEPADETWVLDFEKWAGRILGVARLTAGLPVQAVEQIVLTKEPSLSQIYPSLRQRERYARAARC